MKIINMGLAQNNTNIEELQKQDGIVKIVLAGNGLFRQIEDGFGVVLENICKLESTGEYPELSEDIKLHTDRDFPVIPKKALHHVISWYREATLKRGEEAQVNFYRVDNKDATIKISGKTTKIAEIDGVIFWSDNIFSYTPNQSNSGALTSVHASDTVYKELNSQVGPYVETHSHNSMQAFCSGEDARNSKFSCVQLVFGQLNRDVVQMHSWAFVSTKHKEKLTPEELRLFIDLDVEQGEDEKYYLPISAISENEIDEAILDNWEDKVVKSVAFSSYSGIYTKPAIRSSYSPYPVRNYRESAIRNFRGNSSGDTIKISTVRHFLEELLEIFISDKDREDILYAFDEYMGTQQEYHRLTDYNRASTRRSDYPEWEDWDIF